MSIKFEESDVRPLGRVSMGVKGITLDDDDCVVGMAASIPDSYLLAVTENGFGKRTELDEYKVQSRGGKGILTYRITDKTGKIAGVKLVNESDDILLISSDGTIIRMSVSEISILGRATQGVTLMRTAEGSRVVSIARMLKEEEQESEDSDAAASENDTGSGEE
jgi:DNA gyrase subunit A